MKKTTREKIAMAVIKKGISNFEKEELKEIYKSRCSNIIGTYLYCRNGKYVMLEAYTVEGKVNVSNITDLHLGENGNPSFIDARHALIGNTSKIILRGTCVASSTGKLPSAEMILQAIR